MPVIPSEGLPSAKPNGECSSRDAQGRDRLRLLLSALGLTIILLALMWASFAFIPKQLDLIFSNAKWLRFAVVTAFFIAYCLKTYWRARGRLGFWVILLGVFAIHFLGVGYFYFTGDGLPLMVFGPTIALEWALLALAVYQFLGIASATQKTKVSCR